MTVGMEHLKRRNVFVLNFLCLYGMVLGQYIQCPAEDWTVGSIVTLRCYLPKAIYPNKCKNAFSDQVTFFKNSVANTKCTLSNVSTSSCSSSSSDCSCESGNATYYILQSTFTVDTDDAGTWNCTVTCLDTGFNGQLTPTTDNCDNKDVVVHAELSTPTITVATPTTGSGWTVRGSVNITRIFSTAGQYPCVWSVRKDSGSYADITNKAATIDPPVSSTSVRTGHCDFPDRPLPSAPGTYTYRVTVSPGHTTKTDSSVVVARPSADPVVSCNDQNSYIPENTPMTCNCTASDLGQPQGRLVVYRDNAQRVPGNYGESSVQFGESSVSSADNNAVYRCVLDTADNQDRDTTYTLKVAYGPSSADLTNPPVHELDPTQSSTQLTLTCTAVGVNPRATYIWSGSQCAGTTQSTCSFTPTKDDDGAVISCTAVNPISNVRKTSGERTLTIHYPPSSAPEINGYSGGVLYAGQTTAMTCTVTGGNPAVSSVTLTCDSKSQEVNGTSSNISVTASRDHDGRNCTCSAKWKNKPLAWYPKTAAVTLHVYYPPDPPTIGHGQQRYPFLAGESPILYCTLPTGPHSGNPPASLTFEGQTVSQGQHKVNVTLKLKVLTSAAHGRRVVCDATNNFTEHTGTDVTGNITLQVYYISPIVTPLSSINCSMTTSAYTCEVKEGQQVYLNCSADSNPSLATAVWQQGSASSLDFIANRSTLLNHVCHVATTTDNSDGRLPLRNNITVTVLTTYPAQVSGFTSDNSSNITVSEGDSPTLTCKAVGRPTPEISIGKEDVFLNSRQKGQVTAEQQASLTHILHDVTCDATGQYNCEVKNGEGQANTTHLMVFVKCSPRQQEGTPQIPSYLNYKGGSVSTVFPLTVYPAISIWSLEYLSHNSSRPARPALYTLHCTVTQSSRPHLTTCNLTITGATQHDKGLYDLTLDNGVGQPFTFRLQLDVNGTDSKAFPIAAAVGGVLAAGAAVTVAAAGIFIFRRKQREKKKEDYDERAKNGRRRDTEEPEMITNELYGTTGPQGDDDGEDETMIVNTMYETSEAVGAQVAARRQENASAYEDVAHDGIRPMVTAGPPPAAASGATETGLYAIVDKGRQGQPTASTSAAASDDTNVYAAVDKSKKKSAPPQTAAKPEVKPKPGKKPKDKKKKKNSTKPDAPQPLEETEDTANLYGNIGTTSRTAPPGEDGTVYENHAFTGDEGAVGGSQVEATTAGGGSNERSRTVNADGLVYTTVAFSESQRQKENDPFPGREKTEYAKIGFPVKDLADQE